MDYLHLFETNTQYNSAKDRFDYPSVSRILNNNDIKFGDKPNYAEKYLTFRAKEPCEFTLTIKANIGISQLTSVSYSIDGGNTWITTDNNDYNDTSVTITTPTIMTNKRVLWKGIGTVISNASSSTPVFSSTGNFVVEGNVMSLLCGDNFVGVTAFSGGDSNFMRLFCRCYKLISAENLILPTLSLTTGCYESMFEDCTSLTTTPELPATTLANNCYKNMFKNCRLLTSVPDLPATTLANYCYSHMFDACSSITSVPVDYLHSLTLAEGCYMGMFSGAKLTTLPNLPATTLQPKCYGGTGDYDGMFFNTDITTIPDNYLPVTQLTSYCYGGMFRSCRNLTSVPSNLLPATTLYEGCYYYMFAYCTALTSAPVLPARNLSMQCYRGMFLSCSSLTYIKAMFTRQPDNTNPIYQTSWWVDRVGANGTFVRNVNATWTNSPTLYGRDLVPEGWTIETATE